MEKRETYTTDGNVLRPTDWQDEQVQANSQPDVDGRQTEACFADEEDTPTNALSWRTRSQKAKALDGWRIEVGRTFPESARVLRVAWTLEALFGSAKGYARVTDCHLSRKLGIPLQKIRSSMTKLERSGLIVRSSVAVDGKKHRRIWPARANARPATGNCPAIDRSH
jgi:hypothetical protein